MAQARLPGRFRRRIGRCVAAAMPAALAMTTFAHGEATADQASSRAAEFLASLRIDTNSATGLGVVLGLAIFSTVTALLHLRERHRWETRERALAAELSELRARNDRAEVLFASEPQVVVSWAGRDSEPLIEGDLNIVGEGAPPRRILAFGSWLGPGDAQLFDAVVDRLKASGEGFRRVLRTTGGRFIEAEGRVSGGRAVLRLREVTGDRNALQEAEATLAATKSELSAVRLMLDSIPQPVWVRDKIGRLAWVNSSYARAVEVDTGEPAVERGLELLERPAREEASRQRGAGRVFSGRIPTVVAGKRRVLDIVEVPGEVGSAGIATDVSELETLRADLERQAAAHAETLDQLPTAVAIFDAGQRLVFHNAAYRKLWSLDAAFLEARPSDGEILDRLRNERRLPEQADFRAWKSGVLAAYTAVESLEQWWYLPDGRALRVVMNPNPQGGVTYLFDDVSERFLLESRYNALIGVQGETLDSLKEGVAVFATDGRLKLTNPAFAGLWKLSPDMLRAQPHIDEIVKLCSPAAPNLDMWADIRGAIVGVHDVRRGWSCRMARRDGSVVDCAMAPLPDGATLLTFTDVTATVNVERALTDKNEALLKAARLRDDFVHHVSYELRSPLTNIIGFMQLLRDETVGALNDRQREYAGHIMRSSTALVAIVNDILDLATIDNGQMALTLEAVDIRETIAAAAVGIEDRLAESNITLLVEAPTGIGSFIADGKRVRQVLFNLLSNAVGFSAPGQTVRLAVTKTEHDVIFSVSDQGRGIPPEVVTKVFERFESHTLGSRHRGVGLGLAIVRSFVELHGGRVKLDSAPGRGTTVTCIFPAENTSAREAAE
jgi:signal transduction histidine kinase